MAVRHCLLRICLTPSPSDRKDDPRETAFRPAQSPSQQFAPLASVFRRRLLTGVGSASLVALGANFAGITSFLLGFWPKTGRNLKLDVLYPVGGFSRYVQTNEGFEFIYPANWVGDKTLLNRAVGKLERSLDPPIFNSVAPEDRRPRRNVNEPVVAFGPPGSTGELNVSVVVSPVPLDFSIEAYGGPKEVGETVIRAITGSTRGADVKGTLVQASLREDSEKKVKYYALEYRVESPMFRRHNMAVCCAKGGRLFTLNAQAPELAWPKVKSDFYSIADSFNLTS
ncbi:psbP domain-containing protein 7, chloroplastic [Diospyros lotus]|uniref:psbP domain-containing protein 7, chloroplastic n=1 Tax=Diospyros lotus TaxID=55363 RepID=UPI00225B4034|nr:psbP domain-containing protein 7, chloroplastic [Diospyros lotus]XP_052204677.1 psbP domain-containing protein 7, chloroplastic [Diospyros lotus]XP_052204686.1 psbP domain-containing protein 7, chloroplastic [Diospyros lotus]XP_052204694.1 psbP domain-containing protein 7, chloroplastic [Diospyros lotus]XP_052204696.1 psbP domain-containing protein 7, chloroplastic [Diospyros lotus]XP_052204702.1 psbP domain-containing protein 7, chloroplastic [Diospyros lotus]